jgi:hypothetical protein
MKKLTGTWIGTIRGTNQGAVFAKFSETNGCISGEVHINDPVHGTGVYTVSEGKNSYDKIRLVLIPNKVTIKYGHGIVTVLAHLVSQTQCEGEWRSTIGTAGTLTIAKMDILDTGIKDAGYNDIQQMKSTTMICDQGNSLKSGRTKVFVSYSHEDSDWLKRLKIHLKPLERDYAIDIWEDTKIQPGSKWLEEIEKAIQSAKIALLIISADYLASDFIVNNELPPLLDAANKDGAVIMPLIVSPSRFMSVKNLSQFQAINDPKKPLINMSKGAQEEILVNLTEKFGSILRAN